jgi:transposase
MPASALSSLADGDRQANAALHHIVKNRMTNDQRTRAYRDAHLAKGWTNKAVHRALKRAVAREVFGALSVHCVVPDYTDYDPPVDWRDLFGVE